MSAAKTFERRRGGRVGAATRAERMPEGLRRALVYLCVAAAVFLAGFVPMWLKARSGERQLASAQRELSLLALEHRLASAALEARRGEYEPARRQASDFFTELRAQTDASEDSALDRTQRDALAPLLDERDETITLLARSDPAAADRLSDIYALLRQRLSGTQQAEKK